MLSLFLYTRVERQNNINKKMFSGKKNRISQHHTSIACNLAHITISYQDQEAC